MKRVLFYDDTPIWGGHQLTAVAAARHLARLGVEVLAAFPATNERLSAAWREAQGIRSHPLELRDTRWQPLLAPFGFSSSPVRTLFEEARPDLVVAVQGTIVQSNRGVEQARRLHIPVVSFVPMGVHFGRSQWACALVGHILARWHYRRPRAFLTISEHSRRELLAGGARAPIRVVYCGAEPSRLRNVDREEARRVVGLTKYTVAIIGRVSYETKGHDVMLRALTRIQDAELLIVGDGPDDAAVDAMIERLHLTSRVRRLGWLEDMSVVYSAVDMLAIPSRWEGLPLVALEAMYYSLPIVAADMGAMREILPPSWIVPVGDDGALARRIDEIRGTDQAARLAEHRDRIIRELNEEAYAQRFAATLEELYGMLTAPTAPG